MCDNLYSQTYQQLKLPLAIYISNAFDLVRIRSSVFLLLHQVLFVAVLKFTKIVY